jgi:hypothetical protein
MIDLGTGNNNKMYAYILPYLKCDADPIVLLGRNWAMDNKQEVSFLFSSSSNMEDTDTPWLQLIDIIETVYRGASKGRGLVVSPKGQKKSYTDHLNHTNFTQQTTPHDIDTKCPFQISSLDCVNIPPIFCNQ